MKVHFGQVYLEPGIEFPFSHHFQKAVSKEVSRLVTPSKKYIDEYGRDFELMMRISARSKTKSNEIVGPAVFRKTKDVEFTIFLPYDAVGVGIKSTERTVVFLLNGVVSILNSLEIETAALEEKITFIAKSLSSDPKMLDTD